MANPQQTCPVCTAPLISSPDGETCVQCQTVLIRPARPKIVAHDSLELMTHVAAAGGLATIPAVETVNDNKELPYIKGFDMIDRIGQGTGGQVYLARQHKINRIVAIKVLNGKSEYDYQRFIREVRALGKIQHQAVVSIYDAGETPSGYFILMEFMAGGTLTKWIEMEGPLSNRTAAQIFEQLASGLDAVHQAGFLHRDIKPSNILLDTHHHSKVADFGLVKSTDFQQSQPINQLTMSHMLIGTPAYMSPEQAACHNDLIDQRSDVYGLCAVMYFALTGKQPFNGNSVPELIHNITNQSPTPLRTIRRSIDPLLEAICLKGLAHRREQRYQSMAELKQDLKNWQDNRPTIATIPNLFQRALSVGSRYRRMLASSLAMLIVACSINFAVAWVMKPNPNSELQYIRREIASGKEVTLLGLKGEPRWYNRDRTDIHVVKSGSGSDVFSVSSRQMAFVELLPEEEVPARYIFKGEVLHESNHVKQGYAGLYLARWTNKLTEQSQSDHWITVQYNDFHQRLQVDSSPESYMQYVSHMENRGENVVAQWLSKTNNIIETPALANGQPPIWRHIEITVNPSVSIVVNPAIGQWSVPWRTLDDLGLQQQGWYQLRLPDHPIPERVMGQHLKGSLGLWACYSHCSFRNVTIQKLPEENN